MPFIRLPKETIVVVEGSQHRNAAGILSVRACRETTGGTTPIMPIEARALRARVQSGTAQIRVVRHQKV